MGKDSDMPRMVLDLRIPDAEIQRRIRAQFTSRMFPFLWWELDTDHKSGTIYSGRKPDLAICKLVHVPAESHKITVETRSGRARDPIVQKWWCTCGSSDEVWQPIKVVQAEVAAHEKAVAK